MTSPSIVENILSRVHRVLLDGRPSHPSTTTGPQVTQHQIRQKGFASLDDLQSCKWHINKSPISHSLSALLSVKTMELCAKKVKTMEHVNNIIDLPIWSHTRGFCFSMTRGPSAHLNKHQGPGHGSNRTTNPHPPDVSLRLAFTLFINSMVSKSYKEWIKNTFYIYNRTPVATAHDQRGMRKYASI